MTPLAWRKWRDDISSTFDLDNFELERLRETLDVAAAAGVKHVCAEGFDPLSLDSLSFSEIQESAGLGGVFVPKELR